MRPFLPPTSRVAFTAMPAAVHSFAFDMTGVAEPIARSHTSGSTACFSSTVRARRWMRIVGISILTGHTSPHAPHRDEAKGRVCTGSSWAMPWVSWGVRIAPIGPGYTEP